MNRFSETKLKYLMTNIPSGLILTSKWLGKLGYSSKLIWNYVQSGWLEKLGNKAYKRANDHLSWSSVVEALQNQLQMPLHVGAKTSLQILGRAHFVPFAGIKTIFLFSSVPINLPTWVRAGEKAKQWDSSVFRMIRTNLFSDRLIGLIEAEVEGINIQLSSPERAMMEVLYCIPKYQSYEEAKLLMENLVSPHIGIVQDLLESCQSIKVKRLFLHLADICYHDWVKDLSIERVNLGKGERIIAGGGKYDTKYHLSVPKLGD